MGLFFPNTKPKETNANPRPQEEVLSFWDWFKIVLQVKKIISDQYEINF